MKERIFINDCAEENGWIMDIIAEDIAREANSLGYKCRQGSYKDYQGEEIVYHLHYHLSVPFKEAKHNSAFYTHHNNILKEDNLVSLKDKFDSIICMSPEDAQVLIELGFDSNKVFGKTLPVRNTYIKPISIGIFSRCYSDGRKNESWLLDYCKSNPLSHIVNFVFVGAGWGAVVEELSTLGCSFEWINISRSMPHEYQYQQNKLADLDYYIYMGMDGGAMGTYDAYAQGVKLCVTFDGYHKSLPFLDYCFDSKEGFFTELDKIINSHNDRLWFFKENNPSNYFADLLKVWKGEIVYNVSERDKECMSYTTVLEKKRDQYYKLSLDSVIQYFRILYYKRKQQKQMK